MKKRNLLTFAIIIMMALIGCESDNSTSKTDYNTSVKGTIVGGSGQSLIFEMLHSNGVDQLDTIILNETGSFEFGADVKGQGFYCVRLTQNNFVVLILSEGENISFSSSARALEQDYTVTGSPESERLQVFNRFVSKLFISSDSLARESKIHQANRDVNAYMAASEFQQSLGLKRDGFIRNFVNETQDL